MLEMSWWQWLIVGLLIIAFRRQIQWLAECWFAFTFFILGGIIMELMSAIGEFLIIVVILSPLIALGLFILLR